MKEKQCIVIYIPESISHLPVQIRRNLGDLQFLFSLESDEVSYTADVEKKYTFIWRQQDYLKVLLADILWIEADKSYSCVHLA